MERIIDHCTHGQVIHKCRECKKIYGQCRRENREKYIFNCAKHRARRRGIAFNIDITDIAIPSHCPVLGIPLDRRNRDYNPTLDEVVQGLGYVKRNVCVVSGRANRIKSDATLKRILSRW